MNPFSMPALVSLILTTINLIWVYQRFEETLPPEKRGKMNPERKGLAVFRLFHCPEPATRRTNLVYLVYMIAFTGMEFTLTFLASERNFCCTEWRYVRLCGLALILVQGGIVRRTYCRRSDFCGLLWVAVALAMTLQRLFFGALALMALSIGLVSPTLSALVSLYSSESDQGANLGVFRSAGSLARAIGPLMAALVYFMYGSQSAYLFGAIVVITPLVMALKLPKPVKG